jgi:hypothetical protein
MWIVLWQLLFTAYILTHQKNYQPEYDELGYPVCTEKAPPNPDCKNIP